MDSFFFYYVILLLVHLGFVEANAPQDEETVMMMALTMLRFHNWKLPCHCRFLSDFFLHLLCFVPLADSNQKLKRFLFIYA